MARTSSFNVKGIAAKAGVSTATISRVINHHPGVNEALRGKILRLLRSETQGLARSSRPAQILVVVEIEKPIVEGFLSSVLSGIARYTFEHPVGIELCFRPKAAGHPALLKLLRDKRCEALIGVFLGERSKRQLGNLSRNGVPVVLVGEEAGDGPAGHVLVDSYQGAIKAVDYLASLGHRTVGFLANGTKESRELERRLEGYQEGIRRNGLSTGDALVVPHRPTETTHEAGYRQTRQLLEDVPDVTAIFASTDEMAYGAIRACRDAGRAVPDDISILGFDNYPGAAYCTPALTTVDASLMELGFEAVKSLDQFVNGLSQTVRKLELEGKLVIRESCRPPRA